MRCWINDCRPGPRLVATIVAAMVVVGLTGGVAAQQPEAAETSVDEPMPDEEVDEEGIEIDVRVGARRVLVAMAVPDTIEQGGETGEAAERIESVLRDNLELAGYFDVLPEESFFFDTDQEGMSAANIGFANWLNVGADGLVKSAVREEDGDYHLDLRFFRVDEARQVDLDWSAGTVDSVDEIRPEVNDFINQVVEHYTGDEGMFGTRIAYAKRHDAQTKHIYTMDMDGSRQQRVSRTDNIYLVPTFGPDRHLFFTYYRDGNPDLFVYRNGDIDRLSRSPGQNSGAAYCDGQLAVTMSAGTEQTNIYLVDPQSGDIEDQLTDHWAIDVSPTWSPDCSQLAFTSSRSGGAHIFVMDMDERQPRRLTFQGSYNTEPDWSPDGDRIVFSGRDQRNAFDIFTVDLEGNIERLTQDQGNNFEPSYSPDGRYIVFASTREEGRQLWLMTHDGQVQHRLTDEGSGYAEPDWTR